jgi:hypothetical protein
LHNATLSGGKAFVRRSQIILLALIALLAASAPMKASVLTFDFNPLPAGNDPIDQNYGDRITSDVMGSFLYGTAGGFTPNVVVSYGPTGPSELDYVYWWDQDFGDLVNVVAQFAPFPDPTYGLLDVTLTADPGFLVSLGSFDLAAWPHVDWDINSVQVQDGLGNVLYGATNVTVLGDAAGVDQHTHFDFGAGLTANTLHILIDASNLTDQQGLNVGIDNITFSQSTDFGGSDVPEPSMALLLGGGLCLVGVVRKIHHS